VQQHLNHMPLQHQWMPLKQLRSVACGQRCDVCGNDIYEEDKQVDCAMHFSQKRAANNS
jgi:hypothetical protein